jgi:alkaline phosphatase
MGVSHVTLARYLKGSPLASDRYLVGSVQTRSNSSFITDSGAAATAYACGLQTYNYGVGVMPNATACGTVLEAAHAKGLPAFLRSCGSRSVLRVQASRQAS